MTSTTALPSAALVSVEGTWGLVRLGVVVVVCAGLAAALNRWGRLGHARDDLVAAARATVQLTLVGLVIAAVLRSWPLTLAFIAVMLTVASVTAGRRLVRGGPWWWAFAPVLAAAVPVSAGLVLSGLVPHRTIAVVPVVGILVGGAMTATTIAGKRSLDALRNRRGEYEAALSIGLDDRDAALLVARDDAALALVPGLVLSGLVPHRTIAVVPVVGILVGGAMTATTIAGKRSLDALRNRRGEYEAALSIGLEDRDAALLVARDDAALALVPGLDQTRTVGLVTLPGAFVGMLLGGASPLQAAAVQLLVLVGLLLVQSVAVLVTLELVARGRLRV